MESCPRCCMPSGFPRSRVPDRIADFLSSSPLQVFHLHAVWRCAIQVFSPSSMADIPATEHLVMGLGRHGRHQAMTQVMGAMPIEDLLENLQEQKKAMLVTCLGGRFVAEKAGLGKWIGSEWNNQSQKTYVVFF